MSTPNAKLNRVKEHRLAKGQSQVELAQAAGISRAGLSAIEIHRLVPSVSTALALAKALQTSVEALFDRLPSDTEPVWAYSPSTYSSRFWAADVRGRAMLYPVEPTSGTFVRHDGVAHGSDPIPVARDIARRTLVIATCDPAAGYLALEYGRQTPFRMIVLRRSSRDALGLIKQGLAHVAGVHLAESISSAGNQQAIEQERLPFDVNLFAMAKWQEGVAHSPGIKLRSVRQAINTRLRWIGRSQGAGARRCQDEVLGSRRSPRHIASDHGDVVASIRSGFADAGICVRLVAEEAHVNFLNICEEDYDLCFPSSYADDPRLAALVDVVRSPQYRETIADLPGYQLRPADLHTVRATAGAKGKQP